MITFLEWLENYTMMHGQNVHAERPHGQMGADGRIYGAAGGTATQHPDGTWRGGGGGGGGSKAPPPSDVKRFKKGQGKYEVPVRMDLQGRQRVSPVSITVGGAHDQEADKAIDQLVKMLQQKGFQI
jgi:hypothetical protein